MISIDEMEPAEMRYRAWVNNKVLALYLTIDRNRPREIQCLLKHEFFLEEIEHHFMDSHAGYRIWRAFNYLKCFLKSDAYTKVIHRKGALRMLGLIYERLGFDGKKILSSI